MLTLPSLLAITAIVALCLAGVNAVTAPIIDELNAAKQALRASLLSTPDAPASIENYYASAALSGLTLTPEEYMTAVEQVTVQQVAQAARLLELHTVYVLKGVTE